MNPDQPSDSPARPVDANANANADITFTTDVRRAHIAALVTLLIASIALGVIAMGRAGPPQSIGPGPPAERIGLRLDPNTANRAQLQLLPRIGPVLSQRIIEHRHANGPFRSLADLDAVHGIGPRTLARLEPYLVFGVDDVQPTPEP